ncbi:MAG: hypothetical protein K2R98_14580 [Gemmataceae bacterium]|nr:hypothetical protein [Gemmataceae bacterium]
MNSATTSKVVHALRGKAAAAHAVAIRGAGETLFHEVGQHVLTESTRQTLRTGVEEATSRALKHSAPGLLRQAASGAAGKTAPALTSNVGREFTKASSGAVARAAGVEVLKGAGRAAGVGLALDGAVASVEAVHGYCHGRLTGAEACTHVAREASTGALAAGGGVLLATGLVVVTGGMAAPAVALIAAGGSIGFKLGLKRLFG